MKTTDATAGALQQSDVQSHRTLSVGVSVSSRVHDSEVERVSRRSAALAWWSADAESDGERRGPGVCEGRGYHAHHRTPHQVLVTCYGYR